MFQTDGPATAKLSELLPATIPWRDVTDVAKTVKKTKMSNRSASTDLLLLLLYTPWLKWHYHETLYKQQCHLCALCSHSNSYNWSNHVRSSLKDVLKSCVSNCRLNARVRSSGGRRYSIPGPCSGHWKCSIAKCTPSCHSCGRYE